MSAAEIPARQIFTEAGTLNLRALFLELWSRRWWVIAITIVVAGAFTATAFLVKPVYRASTVLIPVDPNSLAGSMGSALGQISGLAALAGVNLGGGNTAATQEALAVLQSREFVERFITDERLMSKLFYDRWDPVAGDWKVPPEKRPTITTGYKYFQRLATVSQDKKTGLVTLAIKWTDPLQAAEWTNALVARLNAEMRARSISKADASIAYLEKELTSTNVVGTRDAINRLIEAQIKQRMLASVSEESVFRIVDRALPAEPGDVLWPRKLILIPLGPVVGFILGIMAVLIFHWVREAMALAESETTRK